MSAFKEDCSQLFPLEESSFELLNISSLDDILGALLRNRYGSEAVRYWETIGKQLFGQRLKSLERLAF